MDDQTQLPEVLELTSAVGFKLFAHEARQRVIAEIYDGRELTATEAAELCGLTPSAMSYHLRMLQKAGVVELTPESGDGRERRYRRMASYLQINAAGGSGPEMHATMMIWIDSLSRAVNRWLAAGAGGHGGFATESLRLTEEQNAELIKKLRGLYRDYAQLSDTNGPETPRWESYWAHLPKVDGVAAQG